MGWMSIEAVNWVLIHSPTAGNAKMVLVGIANHAHPDGSESYPAVDTLALYARVDRRTVQRKLRELEAAGHIRRDGVGPQGQAKWRLIMVEPSAQGGDNLPPRQPAAGAAPVSPQGAAPVSPEPSFEPSIEGTASPLVDGDVQTVFDEWLKATHRDPKRWTLTPKRRRQIKEALKQPLGLEGCIDAVRNIGADAWAGGQNDRGRLGTTG